LRSITHNKQNTNGGNFASQHTTHRPPEGMKIKQRDDDDDDDDDLERSSSSSSKNTVCV
jgi:hypothetical protein